MIDGQPQPQTEPALVLERWNSWVRLYFPSSGGTGWINLEQTDFELLDSPPGSDPAPCKPRATTREGVGPDGSTPPGATT